MDWLNHYAAAIQALAAIGIMILTAVLVFATVLYVRATSESLKIAKAQFEREWQPEIAVEIRRMEDRSVPLLVMNLGRVAAVLNRVAITVRGEERQLEGVLYETLPLVGGTSTTFALGPKLVNMLTHIGAIPSVTPSQWQGVISLSFHFASHRRWPSTGKVECDLVIVNGSVRKIDPRAESVTLFAQ